MVEDLFNKFDLNLLNTKFGEDIDFTLEIQRYIDIDTSIMRKKDEIDDIIEPFIKSGIEKIRNAIEILEKFSIFAQFEEDVMTALKDMKRALDKARKSDIVKLLQNRKQ